MRDVGTTEGRLTGEVMIYGLVDPRTGTIRYVGQTVSPSRRRWLHCSLSNNKGSDRKICKWVLELASLGEKPRMVEIAIVAADQANAAEQHHIAQFGGLLNMNAGGQSMAQCRREGRQHRTPVQQARLMFAKTPKTPAVIEANARMEAAIQRLTAVRGKKDATDYLNRELRRRFPRRFLESTTRHG